MNTTKHENSSIQIVFWDSPYTFRSLRTLLRQKSLSKKFISAPIPKPSSPQKNSGKKEKTMVIVQKRRFRKKKSSKKDFNAVEQS